MRVRMLGSALLLVVALAACDSATSGVDGVAPASPRVSTPAAVDCGTFVLSQGKLLPNGVIDCFVDAVRARRPVRLAVTSPTTEGDPIPVTYTADAGGRVEILTDSRKDDFGVKSVVRQVCLEPTRFRGSLQFADCSAPTTVTN